MIFIDNYHDCDSSWDVWDKLYDIVYKNTFDYLFDFNNKSDKETSNKCKRLYITFDREKQPELVARFPKFKMAGDCIFNFNETKVELFSDLMAGKESELLSKCASNHHSLLNFSFMPITGGLNCTKGIIRCENGGERKSFDRPDVLIAELEKYYSGKPTRLFRRANKEALQWYLNIFEGQGINGYCEKIYLMDDKEMKRRFIDFSQKPICDFESAVEYMKLACDYWKMKENKLRELGITEF